MGGLGRAGPASGWHDGGELIERGPGDGAHGGSRRRWCRDLGGLIDGSVGPDRRSCRDRGPDRQTLTGSSRRRARRRSPSRHARPGWPRRPWMIDQLAWVTWITRSVRTWLTTATWPLSMTPLGLNTRTAPAPLGGRYLTARPAGRPAAHRGPGVAEILDARNHPGEGNALPIVLGLSSPAQRVSGKTAMAKRAANGSCPSTHTLGSPHPYWHVDNHLGQR